MTRNRYIYIKNALVSLVVLGKKIIIEREMAHQQQERMSSQAERGTMKKIVFYCPEMEKMAREVRANDPGK